MTTSPQNQTPSHISPELSTTEYAVLGILAEGASYGFAIAKELTAESDLGRVCTVRRPLVYRALDRLVAAGYAEPVATERGDSGPQRTVHQATPTGRHRLHLWLSEPVEHVRDMRIEFLLKLALLSRSMQSPTTLIRNQRAVLSPTLDALDTMATDDHVELWRQHNAAAAGAYLDALERRYESGSV